MSRFSGMDLSENPTVLALVICDRIIIEEGTKRKAVIDIFDQLTVTKVPAMLMRLSIFVSLRRGNNDTEDMYLGLFSPSGEPIVQSVLRVTDWGNGYADFPIQLGQVPLTEAGAYDLQVFLLGPVVLAQRQLVVQIAPPPEGEAADSPKS